MATLKTLVLEFFMLCFLVSDKALCTMFDDCSLNQEDCPHCTSGEKECLQLENECFINGICEGILIDEVIKSYTFKKNKYARNR